MRLNELTRSLARRWYVVLAGLLVTAGMCAVVYNKVPATFEGSGSLVLMPPSSTVGERGNPYLYLVGMSQALDVLTRRANAAEVRGPVLEKFPGTTYSVDADRSTSGAVVLVKAAGPSPSAAMDALEAALATVPATLKAMQDELAIEDPSRINLKTIVVAPEPTKDNKTQLQLLVVTVGAGLVGTVMLARLLDGLLVARRAVKPDPSTLETPAGTPDVPLQRRQRRSETTKAAEPRPVPSNAAAGTPESPVINASLP